MNGPATDCLSAIQRCASRHYGSRLVRRQALSGALSLMAGWSLCLLFLTACPPGWAWGQDPLQAGPLFDDSKLTLDSGYRTEVLGPLFYHQQKESESTWALPPLLSYTRDPAIDLTEFDFFYPILTYDRYGEQYRWQFFQVLSFASGPSPNEPLRRRVTLFPLYFQQRSSDPAEDYTALAPFYGHLKHRLFKDEIFFVMFPFFSETKKKGVVTDNYVYPFFDLHHGPGLKGWQFWPVVGHEHKTVTTVTNGFNETQTVAGFDHLFVLWPIFFNNHDGIGTNNPVWQQAVLPLYSFERSPRRDSTTVLWPFFSHVDDREKEYREWDAPWPLVVFAHGKGKTTHRVWPLFSRAHSPTLEDNFYLWPVYKYNRANLPPLDRRRTRLFFFLYSNTLDRNTETHSGHRSVYLWPFFIRDRDFNGNSRLQVFAPLEPFVLGSHKIKRDYSPLWSVWLAEKDPRSGASSQSLLWNLYRHRTDRNSKEVSVFFGLYQSHSDARGKRTKLFFIPLSRQPR